VALWSKSPVPSPSPDRLGHRIEIPSRSGDGSIFSIELPFAITESVQMPVSGNAGSDRNGQDRLGVVIDDDALVLESLEVILTERGYKTPSMRM
jgi:hypothetical protein